MSAIEKVPYSLRKIFAEVANIPTAIGFIPSMFAMEVIGRFLPKDPVDELEMELMDSEEKLFEDMVSLVQKQSGVSAASNREDKIVYLRGEFEDGDERMEDWLGVKDVKDAPDRDINELLRQIQEAKVYAMPLTSELQARSDQHDAMSEEIAKMQEQGFGDQIGRVGHKYFYPLATVFGVASVGTVLAVGGGAIGLGALAVAGLVGRVAQGLDQEQEPPAHQLFKVER